MENTANTNRQENQLSATEQGNSQSNDASEKLTSTTRNQQSGDSTAVPEETSESPYRGQGGQEYDVDADDAVNRDASYSDDNDAPEIETVTPETESAEVESDEDIESQRDSDQNINPGDKATNRDFNR